MRGGGFETGSSPGSLGHPTVTATFTGGSGGGSYSNTAKTLLSLTTIEEPFDGTAEAVIRGSTPDLVGCKAVFSYGSTMQPYWVVDQKDVSREGQLLTQVSCWSAWRMMQYVLLIPSAAEEFATTDPLVFEGDTTVEDIIKTILQFPDNFLDEQGIAYSGLIGSTDGVVDVYKPIINLELNDSMADMLKRVLDFTGCALLFRSDEAGLVYLDPNFPHVDYQFDLNNSSGLPFYTHVRGRGAVIPNRVIFSNAMPKNESGQVSTYIGEAKDDASIGSLGPLTKVLIYESIRSDEEATQLATSHMNHLQAAARQGEIYAPLHHGLELYDNVNVFDQRGGPTETARVGRIERVFESDVLASSDGRGTWACHILLGGIGVTPQWTPNWSIIQGKPVAEPAPIPPKVNPQQASYYETNSQPPTPGNAITTGLEGIVQRAVDVALGRTPNPGYTRGLKH